jgi:fluoride ion exporter CrcB/FEX
MARWLHRLVNPELAAEADAMRDREASGVFINRELPELERRFLHQLNMQYDSRIASEDSMSSLARWRETTKEARRVGHPLVDALYQIEKAIFVERGPIPNEAEQVAKQQEWDIDALRKWSNRGRLSRLPRTSSSGYLLPSENNKCYSVTIAGFLIGGIILFLMLGLIKINEKDDYLITYRTMLYSMLLAPFGALLRWQLSGLNGSWALTDQLSWIPAGTLAANLLGAMVSITMIGAEFNNSDVQNFWAVGTIRAIRVGFAGCLTTVSSFVAEVHKFFHQHKYDRGYLYILITLTTSSVISIIIYACIVFT